MKSTQQQLGSAPSSQRIEALPVRGSQRLPRTWSNTPEVYIADVAFKKILGSSVRLSNLLTELSRKNIRYCVFGGWLRDTLFAHSQFAPPPRDVDIVVSGISVGSIIQMLPDDIRPTLFGGIQSNEPPIPFDIWPLHKTFLVERLKLEPTFESLLQTADFNINAGLYFPPQGAAPSMILDAGMYSALATREISFNARILPFPVLQCARLAAYAAKLRFEFSQSVLDFMSSVLADQQRKVEVIDGLVRYQPLVADRAIDIVNSIIPSSP